MTDRRFIFGFLFLLIIVPCVSAMEYPSRVFLEESVVSVDQSIVPGSFKISPDGMRYAYVVTDKNEYKVILDGKEHQTYQDVVNLYFTPDGNHLVYIAKRGNKYFLVYDGIEGKGYDSINASSFSISADSKRYAFIGKIGDKYLVVTETGEGKTYDEIGADLIGFSPDSLSLAYTGRVGDKWILVINGQDSKAYDGIRNLVFSPDSKRIAAVVRVGNAFVVSVDSEAGPTFALVKPESLVFSPDSQQIGYIAADQGREFVVINHQVGKAYDRIISNQIAFTQDGSKTAYAAQLQETQFIVADGVEGSTYAAVMETPPVFNPNGKLAYAAFTGTHWKVVLDGVEQTGYLSIGKDSLLFNNRGSRLAYTAKTADGAWVVVVDGMAGRYYDAIGQNSLTFSPDGKNVVYSARQGNKWLVVLDNQEGRLFDGIVTTGDNQIKFNGSAFFYYCAMDGQKVVIIQERITSKSDFKDFQRPSATQPETQIPSDLSAKEFEFLFNPPDGLVLIETTKTTDSVEAEMMNQQLREEEIQIRAEFNKNTTGYQINNLILKYQLNDAEDQAGLEALSALEGVRFSTFLDLKGSITEFNGLEDFDNKLRTIPAIHYRKYKNYFAKEAVAERFKDSWKASVENYIGKSFRLGEVWNTSAKIPLPNGEVSDVSAKIIFKEETVVGSVPCVLVQVEYDLNSSNLKKFILDMIMNGVPQLKTEPEVDISCVGESIIDPKTLLGYSSQMEMIMKAIIDMPTLGKKEFTYKRIIKITYEYSN